MECPNCGLSEQSQEAIKQFLQQWWESLRWQARETMAGAELPPQTPEALYHQLLGLTLREIAAAAEGLLPDDEFTRSTAYEAVQQVCEWMWARPGMPGAYDIPWMQWSATPVGDLVVRAYVWATRDELMTLTEAARLSGKKIRNISQMVRTGILQGFTDPRESNPQRAKRVLRSAVEKLAPRE